MTTEVTTPLTEDQRRENAVAAANAHRAATAGTDTPPDAIIPDKPVRPAHVPEKFWDSETGTVNLEAWSKAHHELEAKFHQQSGKGGDTPADDAQSQTPAAAGDVFAEANTQYQTDGKLSDEMYQRLATEKGVSREQVDLYIQGAKAKGDESSAELYNAAGGKDGYESMVVWAGENLSDIEIDTYNALVTSGNPSLAKKATSDMYARFQENAQVEGNRVGGLPPSSNSGMFESKAEMTAAMSKPNPHVPTKTLYETDAAYRAEVQRKISASRRAGKNIFL